MCDSDLPLKKRKLYRMEDENYNEGVLKIIEDAISDQENHLFVSVRYVEKVSGKIGSLVILREYEADSLLQDKGTRKKMKRYRTAKREKKEWSIQKRVVIGFMRSASDWIPKWNGDLVNFDAQPVQPLTEFFPFFRHRYIVSVLSSNDRDGEVIEFSYQLNEQVESDVMESTATEEMGRNYLEIIDSLNREKPKDVCRFCNGTRNHAISDVSYTCTWCGDDSVKEHEKILESAENYLCCCASSVDKRVGVIEGMSAIVCNTCDRTVQFLE